MMNYARLNKVALGLAFGVIWGLSILLMGLMAHFLQYGVEFVSSMGTVYIGYNNTLLGSFIGGVLGFLDGFVGGFLIASVYNWFSGKMG
jgi:hypothetical protein